MDLSLSVESALIDDCDLMDMSIDWSKCFDRGPQGIAFQLTERQGIHPRMLRDMYRELRRKFVMTGHVRKEFAASNGIIQVCPLSMRSRRRAEDVWMDLKDELLIEE